MFKNKISFGVTSVSVILLICSCDSSSYFSVGGKATGVNGSVELANNGDDITVKKNGAFTFSDVVGEGRSYNVTIVKQLSNSTCKISNGAGVVTADVTNIVLACTPKVEPNPIVFLSRTQTPGDMSNNPNSLTGLAGANALCDADAQTFGTPAIKAHAHYTALLITSSSTPCSTVLSVNGCAGSYATPSWPLKSGVTYFNPDGVTPFNTVTSNAIFPDTSPQGSLFPDLTYADGTTPAASTSFWFGPQSVYLSGTSVPTAITGWAYSDLANSAQYSANFALCSEWTSQSSSVFGAYGQTANPFHCAQNPCGTSNSWQNYYSDDQGGSEGDTFSASNYNTCDTPQNILCVSSL